MKRISILFLLAIGLNSFAQTVDVKILSLDQSLDNLYREEPTVTSKDSSFAQSKDKKWHVVEATKTKSKEWHIIEPVASVDSQDKNYMPRREYEKYSEELRQIRQLENIPYLKIFNPN
jgi:hypothetical protein